MDVAAKVYLALDIQYLAVTQAGSGGNAGGPAEGVISQQVDRQAVYLAYDTAAGGHQHDLPQDALVGLFPELVKAVYRGHCGCCDVLCRDGAGAALAGAEVALGEQVSQPTAVQAELLTVLHAAGGVFDDPRHAGTVQRQQLLALLQGPDQAGEQQGALGSAHHVLGHIRRHLEQGGELRVILLEDVVEVAIPLQYHLDVQRQGLGLQLYGADETEQLFHGLYADLAGFQGALQGGPGKGAGEQFVGVENQVTAVGPVQGPRLDQVEVRHQRAHLGDILNPADQVAETRTVLVDHRRRLQPLVVYQHIDVVLGKFLHPVFQVIGNRRLLLYLGKSLGLLQYIGVNRIEMVKHRREIPVFFFQFVKYRVDRHLAELPVEFLERVSAVLFPARELPDDNL